VIDLVVVGAGPAGLAAGACAADLGLRCIIVDENLQAGGQYYRQPRPGAPLDRRQEAGRRLIERAAQEAELRLGWSAYGLDEGRRLWIVRDGEVERLAPGTILLATGAFDRPAAFPGWTLPGVMTAGSAQALVKGQGVRPGRRAVVAGSGPFLLVAAANLLRAGVDVVEVVEAASMPRIGRWLPRSLRHPARYVELAGYVVELLGRRVPIRLGEMVVAAEGVDGIQSVRISQRRSHGGPTRPERRVEVDLLCVSYGFVASTEFARLAGCDLTWDNGLNQPVPRVNQWQETTARGVFVAGEACGLGGAEIAQVEGELAAVGAARQLGRISEQDAVRIAAPLRDRLRRLREFASLLPMLFPPPPELHQLASAETIVCRCENVTLGTVLARVAADEATTINELKTTTRVGMGWCQGRVCGSLLPGTLASRTGGRFDGGSAFTARNPVRPVPAAAMASLVVPLPIDVTPSEAVDREARD